MTDTTKSPEQPEISSERIMDTLLDQLGTIGATVDQQEASEVSEVGDGIARVTGLRTAMAWRAAAVHEHHHRSQRIRPCPEPGRGGR